MEKGGLMRLNVRVTVQIGRGLETVVCSADISASEPVSSVLTIAEEVVFKVLALVDVPSACVRHYLGSALLGAKTVTVAIGAS